MRKPMLGVALLLVSAVPPACNKKVTAPDCEKFADHMTELTINETVGKVSGPPSGTPAAMDGFKQFIQSQRPSYVKQCNDGLTRTAYDCVMAAPTIAALRACAAAK